MRVQSATCSVVVLVLGILATNVGHGDAQSTRRPLIPGLPSLPPMLQGLSLSNLPGISHIMNMPLPFNVPFRYKRALRNIGRGTRVHVVDLTIH